MKKTVKKGTTIYVATFGRFGKEVNVDCVKEGDKYYEIKTGSPVPNWATIRLKENGNA